MRSHYSLNFNTHFSTRVLTLRLPICFFNFPFPAQITLIPTQGYFMAPPKAPSNRTGNTQTQGHKRVRSTPDIGTSSLPPNKTPKTTEAESYTSRSSRVRGTSAPRGRTVRRGLRGSQHGESGSSAVVSHLGNSSIQQSDGSQVEETPRGEAAAPGISSTVRGGTIADSGPSLREGSVTGGKVGIQLSRVESLPYPRSGPISQLTPFLPRHHPIHQSHVPCHHHRIFVLLPFRPAMYRSVLLL